MKRICLILIAVLSMYSCTRDTEFQNPIDYSIDFELKNSNNNVQLIKAWAANSSSPVRSQFTRRFVVKVKNLGFQKQVMIHQETINGDWVDIPLSFQQQINNDEEIWTGEVLPQREIYSNRFAIKYIVNSETYWDNNNGSDYELGVNEGAYLSHQTNILADSFYTRLVGNYFVVNADVLNTNKTLGQVTVVYTTNNWKTTEKKSLYYQEYFRVGYANYIKSPNQFNVYKWETSIRFEEEIEEIKYALLFEVDGQEFWDNNFGKDYVIKNFN